VDYDCNKDVAGGFTVSESGLDVIAKAERIETLLAESI
jgi:hypothetical protein